MYVERGMYSMKKSIRDFFRELLELLFQAAALVIDCLLYTSELSDEICEIIKT